MMPLRKSSEITGYADTVNGVAYCLNCLEEGDKEKFTPIFLGDEWDSPGPVCNHCFELIEVNTIDYMVF